MKGSKIIRFFTHGGIISPGDLRIIAHFSYRLGDGFVHFGIRQDVMVEIDDKIELKEITRSLKSLNADHEITKDFNSRNIGSSLVALDLFPNTVWLKSDVYFDVLSSIEETPSLKVNITDPQQGLVSLFKGNLNFIASEIPGMWYLALEFAWDRKRVFWPDYIASDDIAKTIKLIEESQAILDQKSISAVVTEVVPKLKNAFPPISGVPQFERKRFPNYDGFHKYGDRYWIGLFNRNNNFSARFIEELARVCSETKSGNIFITPWNSIIVKEIQKEAIVEWEKILGKYGINVQHSSVELNWQVPSLDKKANMLKRYITDIFNKHDVRTYGLTFGIRTRPVFISTTVIIRKAKKKNIFGKNYTILYSESFNHNNNDFVRLGTHFTKRQLPKALVGICKMYNLSLLKGEDYKERPIQITNHEQPLHELKAVYECEECLTIYDPELGDSTRNIAPGTSFHKLPGDWTCSVCEADKGAYQPKHFAIEQI